MKIKFPSAWPRASAVLGLSLFCFCLWGFFELAEDVPEGSFQKWDVQITRAFRETGDLGKPRGPAWLPGVMRDISGMGSAVGLCTVVAVVLGYLWLSGKHAIFIALAGATLGGSALVELIKSIAHRPRPEIVPHLTEVSTSSFPSGHSMLSAVVFLTLGTILARREKSPVLRGYLIGVAAVLSFSIGVSRIYLGVHYPTDVLAGWTAGVAWALLCQALVIGWEKRAKRTGSPRIEAS